MSAQLEDGYTRTANELLERLMKIKLNGTQHNIVYCIIRNTYGFQRKSHAMSLTFISVAVETHKDLVKRELDKLIESKIVKVFKEATFNDPREIGINKIVSDWVVHSRPIGRQSTNQSTVDESVYPQSTNQSTGGVDQSVYQIKKEDLKESSKDITTITDPFIFVLDEYCNLHNKIDLNIKESERIEIRNLLSENITPEFIVESMKKLHKRKIERGESVTNFLYYPKPIREGWNNQKVGDNGAKHEGVPQNVRYVSNPRKNKPDEEQSRVYPGRWDTPLSEVSG